MGRSRGGSVLNPDPNLVQLFQGAPSSKFPGVDENLVFGSLWLVYPGDINKVLNGEKELGLVAKSPLEFGNLCTGEHSTVKADPGFFSDASGKPSDPILIET